MTPSPAAETEADAVPHLIAEDESPKIQPKVSQPQPQPTQQKNPPRANPPPTKAAATPAAPAPATTMVPPETTAPPADAAAAAAPVVGPPRPPLRRATYAKVYDLVHGLYDVDMERLTAELARLREPPPKATTVEAAAATATKTEGGKEGIAEEAVADTEEDGGDGAVPTTGTDVSATGVLPLAKLSSAGHGHGHQQQRQHQHGHGGGHGHHHTHHGHHGGHGHHRSGIGGVGHGAGGGRLQPPKDGFNLTLLVGKVEVVVDKYRVDGSRVLVAEVEVGDETGSLSLRARDDQIDLLRAVSEGHRTTTVDTDATGDGDTKVEGTATDEKPHEGMGGAIVLRNCTVELYQGRHLRLAITKWGKLSSYPDGIASTPSPPLHLNRDLNFSSVDLNDVATTKAPSADVVLPGHQGALMSSSSMTSSVSSGRHHHAHHHHHPSKHQAVHSLKYPVPHVGSGDGGSGGVGDDSVSSPRSSNSRQRHHQRSGRYQHAKKGRDQLDQHQHHRQHQQQRQHYHHQQHQHLQRHSQQRGGGQQQQQQQQQHNQQHMGSPPTHQQYLFHDRGGAGPPQGPSMSLLPAMHHYPQYAASPAQPPGVAPVVDVSYQPYAQSPVRQDQQQQQQQQQPDPHLGSPHQPPLAQAYAHHPHHHHPPAVPSPDHYKRQHQIMYQQYELQQRHAHQMHMLQQQQETQRRILEQQHHRQGNEPRQQQQQQQQHHHPQRDPQQHGLGVVVGGEQPPPQGASYSSPVPTSALAMQALPPSLLGSVPPPPPPFLPMPMGGGGVQQPHQQHGVEPSSYPSYSPLPQVGSYPGTVVSPPLSPEQMGQQPPPIPFAEADISTYTSFGFDPSGNVTQGQYSLPNQSVDYQVGGAHGQGEVYGGGDINEEAEVEIKP